MSHTYLIELYEYIGRRRRNANFTLLDTTLPVTSRKAAEGAEVFLADVLEFLSTSYHGKLPKRLRIKHQHSKVSSMVKVGLTTEAQRKS